MNDMRPNHENQHRPVSDGTANTDHRSAAPVVHDTTERHPGPSPQGAEGEHPQTDGLTPPPNSPKPNWAREPGPFEDLWIAPLVGITVLIWIRLLMAAVGLMPLF